MGTSSKDKKKNKLVQSSASWLGVKPGQLNKNIQTANKTVQQAQKQNSAASRSNVQSSASWKGVTPSQVAKPAQAAKPAQQQPKPSVVSLPTITPGRVSPAQQQRNAVQSARTLAQNDNSMRARIARSHEAERQQLAANAAAIKQDKSRLASNSLKWHQTSDAAVRQRLEAENSAIRARRGYAYDSRTGSTFDSKGNELSLAARQIYGDRAETAKQFRDVVQTKDFVRDTSRTAAQPSILDIARGVTADNPHYAIQSGQKAHSIIASLLNRSGETWTDADTKARDEARTALHNEMTALFRHYGVDYQPRWNEQQTADMLRRAGADEGTVAYAMENVRLRDSTDRLGQGFEAIGKRAVASIPSLIDTAKQALANRNEDYENDEYRSLTEREQALEAQLQSMVSQNADGSVPEDYQRVCDELQNVRNRANALKTTKGVNPNTWSQTMLREANEAQANAEAGLAPAPRWLTEQAISLAGNAPSMAISTLPGGTILGSALIGAQAAGQRTFELNEQGKSAGEALGRGLVSGVIEAATEKLPLERMAEILHSGGTNAVKNILRQMGTEATEEGVSYFLNYVSDLAAADPDAKFSLAELAQSAAGGAFGGLVFGTAGNVASRLALGDANAVPTEYDTGRYTRDVTAELQKADADLRAAKSLPEGAVRDRAIASAYQKMSETLDAFTSQQIVEKAEAGARESLLTEGMQAPERTAATAPVEVAAPKALDAAAQQAVERNRAAFDQARNVSERLGARFTVEDLGAAGGKYENGTITINPYTENPVQQVLVHELTHHLETSGTYNRLQAAALRAFSEEQGVSVDVLRQNITKLYADRGVILDADGANRELAAAYCENRLFKDENSINRLAQTDVSLFQRIRQWISDLAVRLRGTSEQKRVLEVQRLYEKAARNLGQRARGVEGAQYQIQTLPDGKEDTDSKPKFSGLALQREYRQAVENGDMTRAHEILEQKATRRGYAGYDTTAEAQNHIIQNSNPVQDDYHTWIRDAGDVHTFAETLQDPDWQGMNFDPDYTWDMAQDALRSGEITVYSSYPIGTQGGFVTPSRMEAEGYAGDGNVYSKRVKTDDIAWIDPTQGQYAPVEPGNVYKQGLPYAKSLDVTYDDAGRLIPLSRRFDESRTDSRYSLGYSTREIAHPNIMQDAVQYGKTPEQAVYEAKVKREGEQARAQREQTETDLMQSRLADVWSELTELDARGLRHSDEFRDLWDEKNRLNDELAARGEKTGAVLPEIETPQTDSGEHLDPSIFKYPPQAKEMIRAGANAKRTAGDYLDTLKESRNLAAADANEQLYHDLLDSYEKVRPIDAELEQARKITQLSQRDQKLLQSALLGGGREVLTKCENQPGAMRLYDLEVQKREAMKPVNEYNSRVRMEREMQADEWADRIAEFATDKKRGFYYITETPERNTYDIFGKNNRADAEEFNETFYKPVHEAVAEAIRLQNRLRDRISGLDLDKHESAMVQMIGEGKKAAALEYAEKHGIKLDSAKETKLNHAVDTFRETYNELFDMINRAEVRNGLEPTRKRENYFPHFTEAAPDTLIARAMWRIGMKITGKETLPTDLAGQTENFRPGHKWERHLQHREGDATIYDAVKGFDQYIEDISQYIYLTDSIQNLRALEDAVRYRLSDEGTRAKIDEIKSNYSIDALERRQMMENTYDATDHRTSFQRAVGALEEQKRAGMRNFVVELRRYTDSLAGKKHRGDRGIEDIVGRDVYEISKNIEGRVAANMISLNPGSWLTNFIPLTQAGELSTGNLLQGMMDTIRSTVSDDGFVNASTFLTNRYGSDSISKTALRKISDAAGAPMEMIDHFVAETIVRARVAQNLKNHVMLDEAFSEADSYAASLMADRSKGATPGAFEMRNPIVKVFTMYQLETNNQLRHFFKDVPRDAAKRSNSKAGAIALTGAALTKAFAGAYVYNMIFHELTGRDSAFDPIGMIADAFGQLTDDDEDDKKKRALNAATSLGGSIAENLPFIGGVLGGGRVPVSSAIPDVPGWLSELNQGYDSKRLTQDAVKELAKPATYLLLPFGGGAVNRAVQGYMTVKNGGSYRYDKNGEKMLQFPVFGQKPEDWAQAMLFGKSSLKTAQDWAENGYDTLNAKETKAFDTLRERMKWHGEDNSEAVYAAIKAMRELDADAQKRYPSNYKDFAATRKRQMLMQNNDLSAGQKDFLDRELISGGQSGDYTSQDAFDISQTVRESRQKAANEALKHGITAEMFADWDGALEELSKEQNDDGTKTYTTNTALGKLLEDVEANTGMTAGEKEALSDYLLTTAMSESDRDKWNDEVKGKVNASDYVRFKSDLSAYQKEYKGTGADNAANIAEILRGYTNLTDEQRGVLMNTYSETAKSNPFHVSDLEKKLADNSFYKDLNDSGRETLRTYCNEYEQTVAGGKELSGWKAKAYMAKEAGITPETYALFQTALKACDYDENGSYKSAEIEAAVKLLPGLTDKQRGYLWQAAKGGKTSKNNPWGATDVSKYSSSKSDAVNPVEGGTISSGFGPRSSPTEGASSTHKAIDIAAPLGTAVRAAMPGKIVEVTKGYNGGYGNTVSVDHGNGIITKYHHMQDGSIDGVSVGQEVTAGQQIGAVGSTGISTGPHLDFQVVKYGDFVDPRKYIPGYGSGNDYFYSGSSSAGAIASGRAAAESSGSSKKSGGSGRSGGTSWSGLKNLKKPKGLPIF